MRILFVCTGNICRSPTAHAVMRTLVERHGLASEVDVDSAGFEGWHVGEPPDARSRAHARLRGYDLDGLRARRIVAADFERFDLVVALDEGHVERARALCPPELHHRIRRMAAYSRLPEGEGVPDPYDGSEADFERVLDLVEAGCRQLIAELGTEVRPTSDRIRTGQESRSSL
jgi:protein-tyrosine phosphatase